MTLLTRSLLPALLLPTALWQQELPPPGVRFGEGVLVKAQFAQPKEVWEVTDMRLGRVDGDEHEVLVIAGARGYALLDPATGEVLRTVEFERTLPPGFEKTFLPMSIVDADGDGDLEFLARAAHWTGRTSLHGPDGKVIWVYPVEQSSLETPAPESTSYADLDGDGKLEILMTLTEEPAVRLLDHAGRVLWSQNWGPGKVFGQDVLFLDVAGDAKKEIVYVDGKALWARDAKGEVVVKTELPGAGYANHLSLLHSYGSPTADWLLVGEYVRSGESGEQHYRLVGLEAKTLGERVEMRDVEAHRANTQVSFAGKPAMYASIESMKKQAPVAGYSASRLRFRLLDENRETIFEELLTPPGGELARSNGACVFLDGAEGGAPKILVAYGDSIWSYTLPR